MNALADFYRGKRVFLTGHTGFKGSWLALWLSRLGAEVSGYALAPPTDPCLFDEADIRSLLTSHVTDDVRNHDALGAAIRKAMPQIVFHLAAQPLVRRSYREPRETFETNVMGTVNLLEAIRETGGVQVCQIVTSDKCYENVGRPHPYVENDAMGGADPYSSSKGCAELVVSAYRRSFFPVEEIASHGLSLSSARAGNVIGGGDWAEDRIIPDCIRALCQNKPIVVRNPSAVRPWQHVIDPLSGYLLLAMRQWESPGRFAQGFNFGPAISGKLTVGELVNSVLDAWGVGRWETPHPAAKAPHEAFTLQLDVGKAKEALGWEPALPAQQAIAMTVQWYRRRRDGGFDARGHCLAQLEQYERNIDWKSWSGRS